MDKNNNKSETKSKNNKVNDVKNKKEENKVKEEPKNVSKKSETEQPNTKQVNVVENKNEENKLKEEPKNVSKKSETVQPISENNVNVIEDKKEEDGLNKKDKEFKEELSIKESMGEVLKQLKATFHNAQSKEIGHLTEQNSQNWMKVNAGVNICLHLMRLLFDKGIEAFHKKFLDLNIPKPTERELEKIKRYQEGTEAYTEKSGYPCIAQCIKFFKDEFKDVFGSTDSAELVKQIFRKTEFDARKWWDEKDGGFYLAGAGCKINKEVCDEDYYSLAEHFFANWNQRNFLGVFKNKFLDQFHRVRECADLLGRKNCNDEEFTKCFKMMEDLLEILYSLGEEDISSGVKEGWIKLDFIKNHKGELNFKIMPVREHIEELLAQMRAEAEGIAELATWISAQHPGDEEAWKSAFRCHQALYDVECDIKERFIIPKTPGEINGELVEDLEGVIEARKSVQKAWCKLHPHLDSKKC